MRTGFGPQSDYTRTWSPSGEIEYAKLADGTRLRYLKVGSGPMQLILLHTVRTQLDQFQLVIPRIAHAFTVYAIDMPGMGWSDITPGASYTEPALRRAIVEFVKTLDLTDVTLAGESMGATVSLTAAIELEDRVLRVVAFNTYDYAKGVGRANRVASIYVGGARLPAIGAPVTLVYGDHDWSHIPEREANLALLPGARSIALPDTGHFAALEQPARVAEILVDNRDT